MPENYEVTENNGNIKISDEVISTIAAVAVAEVDGANTLSGSLSGIAEIFGKKNFTKGIKVTSGEHITIDVNITVDYGAKIHEVAWNVQSNVKKSVELMSGLEIDKVNVHVVGVEQPKSVHSEEQPQGEE